MSRSQSSKISPEKFTLEYKVIAEEEILMVVQRLFAATQNKNMRNLPPKNSIIGAVYPQKNSGIGAVYPPKIV